MIGESKISRIGSAPAGLSDIRILPIASTSTDSVVTRKEINDLIRQWNSRLQEIQNKLNEVSLAVKLRE